MSDEGTGSAKYPGKEMAGCLGVIVLLASPFVVVAYLHSEGVDLLPTKLTDEETCLARGERLIGHVGNEIQCEHVDLVALLSDQKCTEEWFKADADCKAKIDYRDMGAYQECVAAAATDRRSCGAEIRKTYCLRATEIENASTGRVALGYRWFDSDKARVDRSNLFRKCYREGYGSE